ncbi:MAG: VOC family protein [Acidimicrobiales bacterium]|nr:VOC family protein [Acidimicrobiales bacterium]
MGFHHVALATRDLEATHRFYTEVMGFRLVKVVAGATPEQTGWSKHVFYETGNGELIAFWELHDPAIGDEFPTDLNRSIGLPVWVNHVAFDAPTLADLEAHTRRWREHGITVAEVDHDFCISIYATDPNGIMVEFCHTVRPFTPDELDHAQRVVLASEVALEATPPVRIHRPLGAPTPA